MLQTPQDSTILWPTELCQIYLAIKTNSNCSSRNYTALSWT